jgi:hypothetical protein
MARTHLADIRRLDRDIKANRVLIRRAVVASKTTVTDVYGVGPVSPTEPARLLGHGYDIEPAEHQLRRTLWSCPHRDPANVADRHRGHSPVIDGRTVRNDHVPSN